MLSAVGSFEAGICGISQVHASCVQLCYTALKQAGYTSDAMLQSCVTTPCQRHVTEALDN